MSMNSEVAPEKLIPNLRNTKIRREQRKQLDFLGKLNRDHSQRHAQDPQLESRHLHDGDRLPDAN